MGFSRIAHATATSWPFPGISVGEMQSRRGTALIALSSLFLGLMAVVARTLADRVPASELVVIRHAVGLIAMAAYFLARRRPPSLARPGLLFLRGFFGGGAVLTYFYAIHELGAAPATVLNYISPVYAAVWAALFLSERPSRMTIVGLVLATLGATLVTLSTASLSSFTGSGLGALSGIASGLFGGAAMATIKAVREDNDPFTVFLAFCVVGLAMSAPFAIRSYVPLEGATLAIALLVGVLAIVGQVLFTWGMGLTSATAGSATTQLVPAFAWVLALTWLGERVTALAVVGAVCCVGGVLLGMTGGGTRRVDPAKRPT